MKNSCGTRASKLWRDLLVALVLSLGLFLPPRSLAVTFAVNTTVDRTDAAPGDGRCETEPGNGQCTLRAAFQETNALPGADIILVPPGLYTLTLGAGDSDSGVDGEREAGSNDLDIRDQLNIRGDHALTTIIEGNDEWRSRILHVIASATSVVNISGITVRRGNPGFPGGGIRNAGDLTLRNVIVTNNRADFVGGGLYSNGRGLTLLDSLVSHNHSDTAGGGMTIQIARIARSRIVVNEAGSRGGGVGGGIFREGSSVSSSEAVVISESTIDGNRVERFGGTGGGVWGHNFRITESTISHNRASLGGGGLAVGGSTIINTTISGNEAEGEGEPHDPNLGGGGLLNLGEVTLNNVTVTNNLSRRHDFDLHRDVDFPGGGIRLAGALSVRRSLTLSNSIVARNRPDDCSLVGVSEPVSLGHNLSGDHTCRFTAASDLAAAIPRLRPLASNGGLTMTHALQLEPPLSPAVDRGHAAAPASAAGTCEPIDQRGFRRPVDGDSNGVARCDMGAYEGEPRRLPGPPPVPPPPAGWPNPELVAGLPCDPGAFNPHSGPGRGHFPFCPGHDLIIVDLFHPAYPWFDCRADGPGCGEFYMIDWPRSAGAFDMRFIARPHVAFALMNGNGKIVAKAEPTGRQGAQIDVKDLNRDGLIPQDAKEFRLMVQTLPPGQYFLEAKGIPTRYWAVFSSREDPNRPQ